MHEYHKEELEKIKNEAARLVTGCTKLLSISTFPREWAGSHEDNAGTSIKYFPKMVNGIVPNYQCSHFRIL